jgi:hypothetical protein
MLRRVVTTMALVACAAGYVLAAAERATFILTDGERKSGPVVFHTPARENLINGMLNLGGEGGQEQTFPVDQVAVIDFVGGEPSPTELQSLPPSGQMLAMRGGQMEQGQFVNLIGGDTVRWRGQNGAVRDIPINQVSRIYLNPQSARTVFNYAGPSGVVGTTGQMNAPAPGEIRVYANQPWNNTGITVRRGDRVSFRTSGQIVFGQSPGQTAGPDGNDRWYNQNYPVPVAAVGALIGKVGTSAPFPIGSNTQPIAMPADGQLMLGVNDNELGDNSGFFSVFITKR